MNRTTNLARSVAGKVPLSLLALLAGGCVPVPEDPGFRVGEGDPEKNIAPEAVPRWSPAFGYAAGWRVDRHIRTLADVNGDGRLDIVGFGDAGVYVATSTGSSFLAPALWVKAYGQLAGWTLYKNPRLLGDVNGDGLPDIVGFGDDGVYVSHSTGTSFSPPERRLTAFGQGTGWRVDRHIRALADMNGDGMLDVVGFGDTGVHVALSTGSGFLAPQLWKATFGYNAGNWRLPQNPRVLADVTGDGLADVVGFGDAAVYVAPSLGNTLGQPETWIQAYTTQAGNWRPDRHIRALADVTGDGLADIVGFGDDGVHVSPSTGTRFAEPQRWIADFGFQAGGFRVGQHPRVLADMNADGRADIVGFSNIGPQVSYSTGTAFTGLYTLVNNFGPLTGGWRPDRHVRLVGDVTGDGIPDIVGFGDNGVYVFES